MRKYKPEYILQWEYDRDIFLFDTVLFPYFRKNRMSHHTAWEYVKENNEKWYKIMKRLYKDVGSKMYMKEAFKAPKKFSEELSEKYPEGTIEVIARENRYYIESYDKDLEEMLY